jgi:hypothetical protein
MQRRCLLASAAGTLLALQDGWLRPAAAHPLTPWLAAPAAQHADPRLRAAGWAVLAPNPHNRQPWLLRLDGDNAVTLFCDLERRLPATDPLDRQITMGLGCFAELFALAAAEQGLAARIEPFPEGEPGPRLDPRPVARITLAPGGRPDPLFAAAPSRRSAKVPYDTTRPVPAEAIAAIRAALLAPARFGAATGDIAALRDLVWRAWMIEAETPAAHGESIALMRLGSEAVARDPDGISIWGPQLDPLVARGEITREAMLPGGSGYAIMIARYREMLGATNAYVWQAGPGNSRADHLAAGRDWLRINLAANAAGLAVQPVSQALQEYPEMDAARAEVTRMLGGGTVQMLARIGHPRGEAPPTPRWPAESRILRG